MKALTLLALTMLAGCATMTPAQKRWTGVAVGVIVIGAVVAHRADHGGGPASPPVGQPPVCAPHPEACR